MMGKRGKQKKSWKTPFMIVKRLLIDTFEYKTKMCVDEVSNSEFAFISESY